MLVPNSVARPKRWYRAKLPLLLPGGAVLALLVLTLWIKGPAIVAALGGTTPQTDAEPAKSATSRRSATDTTLPAELQLASPAVAESLGLEFAPVQVREIERVVSCNGRASFNENRYAHIRSRVDGIVRRVSADLGSAVHAGEVLAMVDSPMLGDLKSSYLNAVVRRDQTDWDYGRMKKLAEQQAVPAKNLRESQTLFEQQQTTTANARQQLVNLGFSSDQIAHLAEVKDSSTELPVSAPWDGVVVARHAVEGELVERNGALFALADLETMWVYLNLYESDLGLVRVGQRVIFTADGLPRSQFEGSVDWISPEVDARTRTTQVRALVKNTDGGLRANMFGKGRIVVAAHSEHPTVPSAAVQNARNQNVVFVRESEQTFAVRKVEIGLRGEELWEVLAGLQAGDQVVTTGSFLLKSELEKDKLGEAE